MQPEIEPSLGPKSRQRPARTLLWYLLSIAVVYIVLFETVGMKTALLYLSSGKAYYEVLVSLLELPRDIPKNQKRIFFFGDSTVAVLDDDVAPPAILQRELEREYGPGSVRVIDWAFRGTSMFHHYCLLCKAQDYSPSLIIFEINYRSYSENWEKVSNHSRELVTWTPFNERFGEGIVSPLDLEEITFRERIEMDLEFWEIYYLRGIKLWLRDASAQRLLKKRSLRDTVEEMNVEEKVGMNQAVKELKAAPITREFLQELYPISFPQDHSEFLALQALTDAIQRRGIPFIAYLTPLNAEKLKAHDLFDNEVFDNTVRCMEEIVTAQGGSFLDLSHLLGKEEFLDQLEHYGPEAAEKVARELTLITKEILRKAVIAEETVTPAGP